MRRRQLLIRIFLVVTGYLFFTVSPGFSSQDSDFALESRDRILILAPHPDDEILGCGGIIQHARKMHLPLRIVFLTYGDNNQWSFAVYRKHPVLMPGAARKMGVIRHDEALEATRSLGISSDGVVFLGYPDFRTLSIWYAHWGSRPPARGMLTGVRRVPYADAFRLGAPYKGEEIVNDLKTILREFKPTKIFLSHPADYNGDHRALYLFTRIALWDLEKEMQPVLYPYLIHFKKWPRPKGYHPDEQLKPPQLLEQKISWNFLSLTPEEIDNNLNALKKHKSQYKSSPKYLLSFIRANELFGGFPGVVLKPKKASSLHVSRKDNTSVEMPEELLKQERAVFVGIEEEFVYRDNGYLVFSIKLSRPIGKRVGVSLYVFGYRKDRDFADMPKLHISFGAIKHKILDQDRLLDFDTVKVERKPGEITIRVSLSVLGDPERILTGMQTYTGVVPLDWASWRVLETERN